MKKLSFFILIALAIIFIAKPQLLGWNIFTLVVIILNVGLTIYIHRKYNQVEI